MRLIRLTALTLSFVAVLYMTGLRADRAASTEPVAPRGGAVTSLKERAAMRTGFSPGSVNAAEYWHARFLRMRHLAYRREVRRRRDLRAAIQNGYGSSWLERAFLCIHRYEGSWTDSGAPYWGGLQMDGDFMRHYGGWALRAFGTADHWPVSVQLSTAIEAEVSGRGFFPWPNTARMCGLL